MRVKRAVVLYLSTRLNKFCVVAIVDENFESRYRRLYSKAMHSGGL